jgi:para-aminobenzoate synthetase component 1
MRHLVDPPARVLRHLLGSWVDPATAWAALLADEPHSFWLDSGDEATSYLGAGSRAISGDGAGIIDELRAGIADNRVTDAAADGFALGWVGWLGYELRGATLGQRITHPAQHPDAAFMFVDRAIAIDPRDRSVTLLALDTGGCAAGAGEWPRELAAWREATVAALESAAAAPPFDAPPRAVPAPASASWAYSDTEYLAMIAECQAAIRAGDAYQLCLTNEATVQVTPEPFETYLALRASSPAPHGGLVRFGDVSLLSASPERFLAVSPHGVVESRPIKGTRPRGGSPAADEELKAELLASEKERAENLMIVDLMRNDIARVSEVGSVTVPSLFAVESYPHVHQLVSCVRGVLRADLDGLDAVLACFPAGSMTGAPKVSATLILDRIEQRPRGIYSGAFGYLGLDGRVDLAMVIRSIVLDPHGATVGAGGGITALSVPAEEVAEVALKAEALLRVLGVR